MNIKEHGGKGLFEKKNLKFGRSMGSEEGLSQPNFREEISLQK